MSNRRHTKNNRFEERIISGLAQMVWTLILLPFRRKPKNNHWQSGWNDIQQLMARDDQTAWESAILKADSLLNEALKMKFSGTTLSDRLKNARTALDANIYESAWKAHSMRNKIAHEHVDFNRQRADETIYHFRTVLNRLGVL